MAPRTETADVPGDRGRTCLPASPSDRGNRRLRLPGRFFELNIYHGLYVGGTGNFKELFLGNLPNFRGCVEEVVYNDIHVFVHARSHLGDAEIYRVTWDCSEEFAASRDHPMSLVEDTAFLTARVSIPRIGGGMSFDLKSQASDAVLFYCSGPTTDYVAVELVKGRIRLTFDNGNGKVTIGSEVNVNDGLWHAVRVHFSLAYGEVSVDDVPTSVRPPSGAKKHLDLSEDIYVGGMELNMLTKAVKRGIGVKSLQGCLRYLVVDGRSVSLLDAVVTQGMKAGCVWDYPCLRQPCIPSATCTQQGQDSFRCECGSPPCVKGDPGTPYSVFTKTTLPQDFEIISLKAVSVKEGTSSLVTTDHMGIAFDYHKFGIRESGIMFHVMDPPKHGVLRASIWIHPQDSMFTLLDVQGDRVSYQHDGSEHHQDSIAFEIEFLASNQFILPAYLQARQRFALHVDVSPVNDPPRLDPSSEKVFKLAVNTAKLLTRRHLFATDPDDRVSDLKFTVLSLQSDSKEVGRSYVQNNLLPGTPIREFSQEDVDKDLIAFVHQGEKVENLRLGLKLSDATEVGETLVIRILPFPLEMEILNNTGCELVHESPVVLTHENLTLTTNAEDQDLELRIDIVQDVKYGEVQRLRSTGSWHKVNHFTRKQLEKGKIRYLHLQGTPETDEFKFRLTVSGNAVPAKEHVFTFTFVHMTIKLERQEELVLDGRAQGTITNGHLLAVTFPHQSLPHAIVFRLLSQPKFGDLTMESGSEFRALRAGDNFTQLHINDERILYTMKQKAYSPVYDDFRFQVCVQGREDQERTFTVFHDPGRDGFIEVLETLEVLEGSSQPISRHFLWLETLEIRDMKYNVTKPPSHGVLHVLDPGLSQPERTNVTGFTSEEVGRGQVLYSHLGSETETDSFHFLAAGARDPSQFLYLGTFHIRILLRNDNAPVRVVNRVFQVVARSEKLLTGRDLRYSDPDKGTLLSQIRYRRDSSPHGTFHFVHDKATEIYSFTQQDINDLKVLYRHRSEENADQVMFWVSDGEFQTQGLLEIRASPPFVQVANNTGMILPRGSTVSLRSENLSALTNVNVLENGTIYAITRLPKFGRMIKDDVPIKEFRESDLRSGTVEFEHDGSPSAEDSFQFRVSVPNNVTTDGIFIFRIYPESYWEPLEVVNSKTLFVGEEEVGTITPSLLLVSHPNIPPSEITFTVIKEPEFGFLRNGGTKEEGIRVFDQSLINEGRLEYLPTDPDSGEDFFVLNVTNGITDLGRNVLFKILIIPKVINFQAKDIQVSEGEAVKLNSEDIFVTSEYYRERITEFVVREKPRHGTIMMESNKQERTKVDAFSPAQLRDGIVQYMHDGSESTEDKLMMVARTEEGKESPLTPFIFRIRAVNDEKPGVVNNTGGNVWEGGNLTISPSMLGAVDEDSVAGNVTFLLASVYGGYLHGADGGPPLEIFTQEEINRGRVRFSHQGGTEAGFRFRVTDGDFVSPEAFFNVTVHSLQLRLSSLETLKVFPMMTAPLSPSHLCVSSNDPWGDRDVTFQVTIPPRLGRILVASGEEKLEDADTFTQSQINASRVMYQHLQPLREFRAGDEVVLRGWNPHGRPLEGIKLSVEISLAGESPDGLQRFLNLSEVAVSEGGETCLGGANLDIRGIVAFIQGYRRQVSMPMSQEPGFVIRVVSFPSHGVLLFRGLNQSSPFAFGQEDVDSGQICYRHDHSDTLRDEIGISLYMVTSQTRDDDLWLMNGTLNVTIWPINDQPFRLETLAPSMDAVEGQIQLIRREKLLVTDPDTEPGSIVFEVLQAPKMGKLALTLRGDKEAWRFTQSDIDEGRLVYSHDRSARGRLEPDSFHFKVSDGKFPPIYDRMHVNIRPLTLEMANNSPIIIRQASTVAYLENTSIAAVTNGDPDKIYFNITREPFHGSMFLNDERTDSFGQSHIDGRRVFYMQTNLSVSWDSFEATVRNEHRMLPPTLFNITVAPLVDLRPFNFTFGQQLPLTTDLMSAGRLAEITGSAPVFRVLRRPTLTRLKVVQKRPSRAIKTQLVFSQQDLEERRVYLIGKKQGAPIITSMVDSWDYLLVARDVQPAYGTVKFLVHPEARKEEGQMTPSINSVVDNHDQAVLVRTGPQITKDSWLIASIVSGVVILAVFIIIGIKCTMRRKQIQAIRRQQQKEQEHQFKTSSLYFNGDVTDFDNMSLPHPYEMGTLPRSYCDYPSSPRIIRAYKGQGPRSFSSDTESACQELGGSSNIPQCKVTPLCSGDVSGNPNCDIPGCSEECCSDPDHLGFKPSNPMLRKNQYWV
ncbi:unnamed protein product [Darwinula stevensoni]|uniref:Laminin G domain-containing protein n=1 Tax=Darwinula stevensoni TaxID=69355 RepID=A0A7R9AE51_9CRUS|nr:unnamed protein product [Darwinula stevensoni]CAG0902013.1 unnamed protein product [Darwinula stevensoni]